MSAKIWLIKNPNKLLSDGIKGQTQEETGWSIASAHLLGFTHFHYLNPSQSDHRSPQPDFLQVIYLVEAGAFVPHARLEDNFELDTTFLPIAEARALDLTKHEPVFLDAALQLANEN